MTQVPNVTSTSYQNGFQYVNDVLEFFPHAEGYVKKIGSDFSYVYNYTDHIGNIRLSYSDADLSGTISPIEILEESTYYPFGMKHNHNEGNNFQQNYKYKYNGKEFQDELGLNMYDYGARNYDAALGRWMNIDPLAEQSRRFSPYVYANDNPVFFIDPDGMMTTAATAENDDAATDNGEAKALQEWVARAGKRGKPGFHSWDKDSGDSKDPDPPKKKKAQIIEPTDSDNEDDGSLTAVAVPIALTAASIDGPIPIGDAIGLIVLAGAATYDSTQRVYVTYTLTNSSGKVYVGRTSGFGNPYSIMMARYSSHHMKALGFGNPTMDVAVQGLQGYPAIRGREQQLIDVYGGVGSSHVANPIRGVSKINLLGKFYHAASSMYFGQIALYTGY